MCMVDKIVSPKRSFVGWKFSKWFVGNWQTIKELVKVGLPALLAWSATANPLWTVVLTILGKLVLDTGEFFFSSYSAKELQ